MVAVCRRTCGVRRLDWSDEHLLLCHNRVLGNTMLDGISGKPATGAGWEYGVIWATRPLHEPNPQGCRAGAREGSQAFFTPFAMAAYVGADTEHDVVAVQPDQFRDP